MDPNKGVAGKDGIYQGWADVWENVVMVSVYGAKHE